MSNFFLDAVQLSCVETLELKEMLDAACTGVEACSLTAETVEAEDLPESYKQCS